MPGVVVVNPVDIFDSATRLLGIVYGSQGAQLKQTATNNNLQTEIAVGGTLIDPRSIRTLTAADIVTANQGGSPWQVQSNSLNLATAANQLIEITALELIDDLPHLNLDTITAAKGIGVMGSDGSLLRWLKVDATGALAVQTQPSPNVFFIVGEITSTTTTTKTVEKTVYTEQTTNAQRSLVSTSALDTAVGTGARTVTIIYLDSTGAGPFTETITLNGTVAVNTVATDICFIEKMEVVTVGSTGLNQGTLNLKAAVAGGGATIGSIGLNDLQTFWCHHYIPTGKTMKVTGISVSHNGTTVGSGAAFWIKRKPIPLGNATDIQITDFVRLYGQSSTFSRLYNSPVKAIGPARILMYVTPESASSFIYRAAVDFYEE